jgi:hypothetical protein
MFFPTFSPGPWVRLPLNAYLGDAFLAGRLCRIYTEMLVGFLNLLIGQKKEKS